MQYSCNEISTSSLEVSNLLVGSKIAATVCMTSSTSIDMYCIATHVIVFMGSFHKFVISNSKAGQQNH